MDPALIAVQLFCIIFSLCIHEAAHAAMANRCGDPTARLLGRLTLNPIKHLDPMGSVVFPLVFFFATGWMAGWAKPVPFNPLNLRNRERDSVFIALAGPASNLVMAIVFTLVLRIIVLSSGADVDGTSGMSPLALIALCMVLINLLLMLFNCIPVPPLDGHYVLAYFLPQGAKETLQRIGPFGLIFVFLIGGRLISAPLGWLAGLALSYAELGLSGVVQYLVG